MVSRVLYPLSSDGDVCELKPSICDQRCRRPETEVTSFHSSRVYNRRMSPCAEWRRIYILRLIPITTLFTFYPILRIGNPNNQETITEFGTCTLEFGYSRSGAPGEYSLCCTFPGLRPMAKEARAPSYGLLPVAVSDCSF